MKIIAFTGRKENGKSTVCEFISAFAANRGINTEQINFKDPLIALAKHIGWDGKKDEKGRRLLQRLGTDVVRECIDEDYWVKAWANVVEQKRRHCPPERTQVILVDDVRFNNEARAVRELGGQIIYINTPEVNRKLDTHASENGIAGEYITQRFDSVQFGLEHLVKIAKIIFDTHVCK